MVGEREREGKEAGSIVCVLEMQNGNAEVITQ